jgi:hypothetical protein
MIQVVRSWPSSAHHSHACVKDTMTRVAVSDYNYWNLTKLTKDVIHLDWDVAVSPEMLEQFAAYAKADRERVLVVPMYMYPGSYSGLEVRSGNRPIWNVYQKLDKAPWQRECEPGEYTCDLFGFGMVYIPWIWLDKFAEQSKDQTLTDGNFAEWYNSVQGPTPVCWDIFPVHLNFPPIKEI